MIISHAQYFFEILYGLIPSFIHVPFSLFFIDSLWNFSTILSLSLDSRTNFYALYATQLLTSLKYMTSQGPLAHILSFPPVINWCPKFPLVTMLWCPLIPTTRSQSLSPSSIAVWIAPRPVVHIIWNSVCVYVFLLKHVYCVTSHRASIIMSSGSLYLFVTSFYHSFT